MADANNPGEPRRTLQSNLRRLGKNTTAYFGEGIAIDSVLADCLSQGVKSGWSVETVAVSSKPGLLAFTRKEAKPIGEGPADVIKRVYLSAGIHGDEPAGPLAVRRLIQEDEWPPSLQLWVLPCLNPTGFALNRRENDSGIDLNREYFKPKAEETLAHIRWLERQPNFDLCLCLHEDWEAHGFYLYELNPQQRPSLAEGMVKRVAPICPIDYSEIIEGRAALDGIIRPNLDPRTREKWPESFYLLTHKTHLSYTLEAPSDFPLTGRIDALVAAVRAALEQFAQTY